MYDCQILVCSTFRELPWLNVCLRSVQKYWKGITSPIVVVTPDCKHSLPSIVSELRSYVILKDKELHNYIRLTADSHMNAKSVLFLEPRELFKAPCSFSSFTNNEGRLIVYTEAYHPNMERPCSDDNSLQNQRWVIEDVLGSLPEHEFTYRSPFVFYRHSIRRLREFIETKNKRPLLQVMQLHAPEYFSPFNFLGAYCCTYEKDSYQWEDKTKAGEPVLCPFWGIREPNKGEDYRAIQAILRPEPMVPLSVTTAVENVVSCADIGIGV